MRVGFIGVGNIGKPMAGQLLQAGHALVVHDIRPEAAAALLAVGATWAASPQAVVTQCEVIATCLPGPAEMVQVTLGPDGILAGIRPGSLYIDHTTNAPRLVRQVHALCQAKGVEMLDAPVSGGMEGPRRATCWSWRGAHRRPLNVPSPCSRRSPSGSCIRGRAAAAASASSCTTVRCSPSIK